MSSRFFLYPAYSKTILVQYLIDFNGLYQVIGSQPHRLQPVPPLDAQTRTDGGDPEFPRFEHSIPGGITAWYTMRLSALGEDREEEFEMDLPAAVREYEERDALRCHKWRKMFS